MSVELEYKFVYVNERKVSYLEFSSNSTGENLLLLSPGAADSTFFKDVGEYFDSSFRIIAPDYPGRGNSAIQGDNSVEGVSKTIENLLETLNLEKVSLIGLSYGTQVALNLLRLNSSRYKKVYLSASGEFFTSPQRVLLKTLFTPAFVWPFLAPAYRRLLLMAGVYDTFPDKNLSIINKQWIDTLKFKVPEFVCTVPAMLFHYKKDCFVNPLSRVKVARIFTHKDEVWFNEKHPVGFQDFDSFFSYVGNII